MPLTLTRVLGEELLVGPVRLRAERFSTRPGDARTTLVVVRGESVNLDRLVLLDGRELMRLRSPVAATIEISPTSSRRQIRVSITAPPDVKISRAELAT